QKQNNMEMFDATEYNNFFFPATKLLVSQVAFGDLRSVTMCLSEFRKAFGATIVLTIFLYRARIRGNNHAGFLQDPAIFDTATLTYLSVIPKNNLNPEAHLPGRCIGFLSQGAFGQRSMQHSLLADAHWIFITKELSVFLVSQLILPEYHANNILEHNPQWPSEHLF
ncbi:hypothetical protein ACJX0J_006996, partial [Zea mays]